MVRKVASGSAEPSWRVDTIDPRSGEFRSLGGVALNRLLSVGRPILEEAGAGARLYACFSEAMRILETITITELLACIVLDRPRRRALADVTSHLEHVGLVLPEEVESELGWAASRAGFPDAHARVSSVVVARELGALIGTAAVPTTIFKAYGRAADDRVVCVEAFIPHGVDPTVVRNWVAEGVGVHVALKAKSLSSLDVARRLFEAEGFSMPPFMNGKPITNRAEDTTVLYFDRAYRERRLRVECSWSPEPVW